MISKKTTEMLLQDLHFDEMLNKALTPEEEDYQKYLNSILYEVQELADKWLKNDENIDKYYYMSEQQYDFFAGLEGEWDEIIQGSHGKVEKLLKKVYETGAKYNPLSDFELDNVYTNAHKTAFQFALDYNFGLIRNLSDDFRGAIKNRIIQSAVEGKNPYKTAEDLVDMGLTPLPGSTLSAKQRATMIAKTETSRVQNTGMLQEYINQGFKHVLILTAEDSNVCPICLKIAYQYKEGDPVTFDTRGKERRLDIIANAKKGLLPPFHPNCRCTVMTVWATKGEPPENPYIIDLTPKGKGTPKPTPTPQPPKPKPKPPKPKPPIPQPEPEPEPEDATNIVERINDHLGREVEIYDYIEPKFLLSEINGDDPSFYDPDEYVLIDDAWESTTKRYIFNKSDKRVVFDAENNILTVHGIPLRYSLTEDIYYVTQEDINNYGELLGEGTRITSFKEPGGKRYSVSPDKDYLWDYYVEEIGEYILPKELVESISVKRGFEFGIAVNGELISLPMVETGTNGEFMFKKDSLAPPPASYLNKRKMHPSIDKPSFDKELTFADDFIPTGSAFKGSPAGYFYDARRLPPCSNPVSGEPCVSRQGYVQYYGENDPSTAIIFHPLDDGRETWYISKKEVDVWNAKYLYKPMNAHVNPGEYAPDDVKVGDVLKIPATEIHYIPGFNTYTYGIYDVVYDDNLNSFVLEVTEKIYDKIQEDKVYIAPPSAGKLKEIVMPKKYKFDEDRGIYTIPEKDLIIGDNGYEYKGITVDWDDAKGVGYLDIEDLRAYNYGVRWKDAGWIDPHSEYIPEKYKKYENSPAPIYLIPESELTIKKWTVPGFTFEEGADYYFYKDLPVAKVEGAKISKDGKIEVITQIPNYNDTITPPINTTSKIELPKSYLSSSGDGYYIPGTEVWYSYRDGKQRYFYENVELDEWNPQTNTGFVFKETLEEYNSQFSKRKRKLKVPLDDQGGELIPSKYLEGDNSKNYKYFIPSSEEGKLEGLWFEEEYTLNKKYHASYKHVPLSYDEDRDGYWISLRDARIYDRGYVHEIIKERTEYRKTHKYEDIRTVEEMAKWYGYEVETFWGGVKFKDRIYQSEIIFHDDFFENPNVKVSVDKSNRMKGEDYNIHNRTDRKYQFNFKDLLGMYYDMPELYKGAVNEMIFDDYTAQPGKSRTGGWFSPSDRSIHMNCNFFDKYQMDYWNIRFTMLHESGHAIDYQLRLPQGSDKFIDTDMDGVFDESSGYGWGAKGGGYGLPSVSARIEKAMYDDAKLRKKRRIQPATSYGATATYENWAETCGAVGFYKFEEQAKKGDRFAKKVLNEATMRGYPNWDALKSTEKFQRTTNPNLYQVAKDIVLNTPWYQLRKDWRRGGYIDGQRVYRK